MSQSTNTKLPLFGYGPAAKRAHLTCGPTSSAGTYPKNELSGSHQISSVRRLADSTVEVNLVGGGSAYSNFSIQSCFAVAVKNADALNTVDARILQISPSGSRVGVVSGSAFTSTWDTLRLDFWLE